MYPIWLIILQMGLVQPPTREEEERPEWNNIDNHGNSTVWNGRTLNQWSRELVTTWKRSWKTCKMMQYVVKNCPFSTQILLRDCWNHQHLQSSSPSRRPKTVEQPGANGVSCRCVRPPGGLDVGSLGFCWLVWIARPSPTKVRIVKLYMSNLQYGLVSQIWFWELLMYVHIIYNLYIFKYLE